MTDFAAVMSAEIVKTISSASFSLFMDASLLSIVLFIEYIAGGEGDVV
jgi:hypothetical protein